MNIDQAKRIPLAEILDKLNLTPTQQKNNESWYLSPLRKEKTASFKVNLTRNVWYDHGEGIGGDSIGLICVYLQRCNENHSVSDALRWLKNMMGYSARIEPIDIPASPKKESTFKKVDVKALSEPALIRYLEKRGIPLAFAQLHLKEVRVHNTESGKKFNLIGFRNDDGGYEMRSGYFKGTVGKKYISFVRGNKPKPEGIHIFEGFMDYLSALLKHNEGNNFDDDALILNSLSLLSAATPFIQGYGYSVAYSWMDNDAAGKKATQVLDEFFKTEDQLVHQPMNRLYEDYKDVNDWHMHSS